MPQRRIFLMSVRKIKKESGWSFLIICILVAGLMASILIPSIGSSLQLAFSNYSNELAPWVVVAPKGNCPNPFTCQQILPDGIVPQIRAISGVQRVYPIVINDTAFPKTNVTLTNIDGNNITLNSFATVYPSAVVGGPKGYPVDLMDIANGTFPHDGESAFVINALLPNILRLNHNYTVDLASNYDGSGSPITPPFNATVSGIMAMNPLFGDIELFWNSSFLMNKLGSVAYNQTFGGNGTNYIIIKVGNVADVPAVVSQLDKMLKPYPLFVAVYNQQLIQSLDSFVYQTAPLYAILESVALVAVIAITFFTSYAVAGKRKWEAGLLVSQGWSWGFVFFLYFFYFVILFLTAFVASSLASIFLSHFLVFKYTVFIKRLSVTVSVLPIYLLETFVLSIGMSSLASYTIVRRLRGTGIDRILAEF